MGSFGFIRIREKITILRKEIWENGRFRYSCIKCDLQNLFAFGSNARQRTSLFMTCFDFSHSSLIMKENLISCEQYHRANYFFLTLHHHAQKTLHSEPLFPSPGSPEISFPLSLTQRGTGYQPSSLHSWSVALATGIMLYTVE